MHNITVTDDFFYLLGAILWVWI